MPFGFDSINTVDSAYDDETGIYTLDFINNEARAFVESFDFEKRNIGKYVSFDLPAEACPPDIAGQASAAAGMPLYAGVCGVFAASNRLKNQIRGVWGSWTINSDEDRGGATGAASKKK